MRTNFFEKSIAKNTIWMILAFAGLVAGAAFLPSKLEMLVALLFIAVCIYWCVDGALSKESGRVANVMAMIIWLSAFQNVYLGIVAYQLTEMELQILLTINFAVVVGCVGLYVLRGQIERNAICFVALLFVTVVISCVLALVYPPNITSFISSIRNILTPMVFFLFALVYAKHIEEDNLYQKLLLIAIFVAVFGLVEDLIGNVFWQKLNIGALWDLKHIGVAQTTNVPANWYSSEIIMGRQRRRMVSSFADPVNLGTYLFGAFMLAWYKRRYILCGLLVLCCGLTISKGALLGFMIFAVLFFWFKDRTRLTVPFIGCGVFAAGIAFLIYSSKSSTGSVAFHIKGFVNSFSVITERPFGYGVGRVGVLAGLFAQSTGNASVLETGIGNILAQLGIAGMLIYFVFLLKLFVLPLQWNNVASPEDKILYYSLLFSFIANAMFNEVALSPNSCGMYFVIMGILTCKLEKPKGNKLDSVYFERKYL